jgi:hypothetical protein
MKAGGVSACEVDPDAVSSSTTAAIRRAARMSNTMHFVRFMTTGW